MDRIEKLRDFLKEAPNDSFLKHALALELTKRGGADEAQRLFEEILETQPDYVGSYYHLGKLLERKGEIAQAEEIYQKGMAAAKTAGDTQALNELRAAWENIAFD